MATTLDGGQPRVFLHLFQALQKQTQRSVTDHVEGRLDTRVGAVQQVSGDFLLAEQLLSQILRSLIGLSIRCAQQSCA